MEKIETPSLLGSDQTALPQPCLKMVDAIALIVGIVIGAGIFETPPLVAINTGSATDILGIWLLGGIISLLGALCYAELATTYPHVGGNYYYLKLAFGPAIAILFAWARMTVIQTGSIALLAFVFGDYASQIFSLGSYSPSIYAAGAIVLLTILNIFDVRQSKQFQNLLTSALLLGMLLVIIVGITSPPSLATNLPAEARPSWGLALVFVLLSYGGWNEAAYISAEIHYPQRNIARSLFWSVGIITGIYVLINLAYVRGLGVEGMANSQAVAADLLRQTMGESGARFVSIVVVCAALSSINATIFTGARSTFALGSDLSSLHWLGRWQSAPRQAYLLQGAVALGLVTVGTLTRKGFETMVSYTAPVFWFFFLLSTLSLIILRFREPSRPRPFRSPFYPLVPLLFCASCGYLLYSSLVYTGYGAIVGVIVVLLGLPLIRRNQR